MFPAMVGAISTQGNFLFADIDTLHSHLVAVLVCRMRKSPIGSGPKSNSALSLLSHPTTHGWLFYLSGLPSLPHSQLLEEKPAHVPIEAA